VGRKGREGGGGEERRATDENGRRERVKPEGVGIRTGRGGIRKREGRMKDGGERGARRGRWGVRGEKG